jgi:hypothetical protein
MHLFGIKKKNQLGALHKIIKIMFFLYFLKIIFDISILKLSKNIKK